MAEDKFSQKSQLQFLAEIVEHSDDAIFTKTLDGVITSWNRAAEKIYGYKAEEIVGQSIALTVPEEYLSEQEQIMERVRTGIGTDHCETVRKRRDGMLIDVSVTVSPIRNRRGEVTGASTIARDITASKQAEKALRGAEKLAAMGRMAATVAHEINTPLDAAKNIVFLLKQNPNLDANSKELVDMLDMELEHVIQVCRRTMEFARQANAISLISVADLFDGAVMMLRKQIEGQEIEVEKKYRTRGEVLAYGGPLRQVCVNLLGNAIDAIPKGRRGRIIIRVSNVSEPQPGVVFTLCDNGTGIPSQNLRLLFRPFFSTKAEKGTGLGLWVSHGVIMQHGGSIRVRSRVYGNSPGTCFRVFIPDQATREAGPVIAA